MAIPKAKIRSGLALFIILIMTAASVVAINQYRFGVWDHTVILPLFQNLVQPGAYNGDYLLQVSSSYHTVFWPALASLVRNTGLDTAQVFFGIYCLSILGIFLGVYFLALTLFSDSRTALLACFLILFSKRLPGGGFSLDEILYTRTAALPFLIFGLNFFFRNQFIPAGFLYGIGFLIHPLSAVGFILCSTVALLINPVSDRRRQLLGGAIMVALCLPLLRRQSIQGGFFAPVEQWWVEIIRLRSSHHVFPLSWDASIYFELLLLLAVFFAAWKYRPSFELHRRVEAMLGTVLFLALAGLIFTEFIPLRLVIQLQLFRAVKVLYLLAAIYLAHQFIRFIDKAGQLGGALAPALIAMGLLYGSNHWQEAIVILILLAAWLAWQRKGGEVTFRSVIWGLGAATCLLGVYCLGLEGWDFSIKSSQRPHWQAVQAWAKEKTTDNDIFIVPPTWFHEGFRLGSGRRIYGNWKDGTMANWSPDFGREWLRRMKRMGLKVPDEFEEDFRELRELDFLSIAQEIQERNNKIYLVYFTDGETLGFPVVYRNNLFSVYRLE